MHKMNKRQIKIRDRALKKLTKIIKVQASMPEAKKIQANLSEGEKSQIILESLLTGLRMGVSIPGTMNAFIAYEAQVSETYRKYNGFSSFGGQQTRCVVDLRTAFISGEGISISCGDENTSDWIETFLNRNLMNGSNFINAVKGSEMAGQSLLLLKKTNWYDDSVYIRTSRVPYNIKTPYRAVYVDPLTRDEVKDIEIKKEGIWASAGYDNYIYVRTGGDDSNSEGPVTRVGIVLTDIENYDRAIKDMRRNNHIFARITPVWQTENDTETNALKASLEALKWKIGEAFIGRAKFSYESPKTGAYDNLTSELVATIKTISSVTGIPVHWLGYVDLMSNRSTAETLYELIKNATILDRQLWENALYNLIIKAQELYINAGGDGLSKLDTNFEVRLPLIDFNEFLNRVKGLNLAFMDNAISMDDYRNALPGIDPLKTKRAIEKEEEEEKQNLMSAGNQFEEPEFQEEE